MLQHGRLGSNMCPWTRSCPGGSRSGSSWSAAVRDFKDTAFSPLCETLLAPLRQIYGLRIVVFLSLRIGATQQYILPVVTWGSDYNLANYNFHKPLNFKTIIPI